MLVNANQLANIASSKVEYDPSPSWGQVPGRFGPSPLGNFSSDARVAITQAPDYFVWWYTAKSIGLGLAVGLIGFMIGRATARK